MGFFKKNKQEDIDNTPIDMISPKALESFSAFKCNFYREKMLNCYNKLENSMIFKKKMYKECQQIEAYFKSCMLNNNLRGKTFESGKIKSKVAIKEATDELVRKELELKSDYASGKISREEMLEIMSNSKNYKEL